MHGIHGRAPALATGVAAANPDLSVWVVSGDGDALSIGGNHLIHALRRNVPLKILLFNNQIYGLTKGQYSPTSEEGKVTKSTPFGSQDHPFNPVSLALGAEASFVARTVDTDKAHVAETLRAAAAHQGTAFVEIYQNCNVFNDGAFDAVRAKGQKELNQIRLVHGEPIRFGAEGERGVARGADGRLELVRGGRRRRGRAARPRRAPARPEPRLRARPPRPAADRPDPDRRLPRRRAADLRRRAGAASCARRARSWGPSSWSSCCTRATPGPSPSDGRAAPPVGEDALPLRRWRIATVLRRAQLAACSPSCLRCPSLTIIHRRASYHSPFGTSRPPCCTPRFGIGADRGCEPGHPGCPVLLELDVGARVVEAGCRRAVRCRRRIC